VQSRFRFSSIVVASAVVTMGALVGCGSADEEEQSIVGPPPSESTVFSSQSETKKDLGIEKWGFETDESGDMMTYRGYGANNEVLATVRLQLDASDPMHLYFTLEVSGKVGNAVEKIEFYSTPSDDGTQTVVYTEVKENSFDETDKPFKVLVRFKEDGAARQGGSAGGSLVTQARPLDGQQLVDPCKELNEKCQIALIDNRIAASGASSECGLLKMVGVPVISGAVSAIVGAGVGAGVGLLGGPAAPVTSTGGAIIGGVGGAITGASGGVAAQAASCWAARRDARAAQQELNQCRAQQQAQGCR
jgi:hypothetical protein